MVIKPLAPRISVSAQIAASDVAAIAQAGFKSIICNRPDGEGADQPNFKEIEAAALSAGLQCHYLPVESGQVTDAQSAAFGQLLEELPGPVLAYCRSGMRCTTLWALSHVGKLPGSQLIQKAKTAGFDLTKVEGLMQA